jgi:ADP-ribose pyrophosphatase
MVDDDMEQRRYYEHDASYDEWYAWYHESEHAKYQHPDVTVDAVIMTFDDHALPKDSLKTLLIRRYTHPFRGMLSLPGTFLHADEHGADESLSRMLTDRLHADINDCSVQQLRTYTGIDRDPRGQVVSIAHMLYMRNGVDWLERQDHSVSDGMQWVPINEAAERKLAFDHNTIIDDAIARLRSQFGWTPNVFDVLPEPFTLTQAMKLRSSLFDEDMKHMSRANFKKKYQPMWNEVGLSDPSDERSSKLFTFSR